MNKPQRTRRPLSRRTPPLATPPQSPVKVLDSNELAQVVGGGDDWEARI